MSDVKRWAAMYHPLGYLAGAEVATMVLASDYDALKAELDEARNASFVAFGERDEARDLYAASSDNAARYLADNARLREALTAIASFDEVTAKKAFATYGSIALFDESDGVRIARRALAAQEKSDE